MSLGGSFSDSGFSSSLDEPSQEYSPQAQQLSCGLGVLQQRLVSFECQLPHLDLLLDKCLIPYDLLQARNSSRSFLIKQTQVQVQLAAQIAEADREIGELQARVEAARGAEAVLAGVEATGTGLLREEGERSAGLENDLILRVGDQGLEEQIARKEVNEQQMIAVLRRKVERERASTEQWRQRRRELEKREHKERGEEREGRDLREHLEGREGKLVEDRLRLLELDVGRLRRVVREERALQV